MPQQPTWDDVTKIESLVSSPSKFKIEVIEVFGQHLYEEVYRDGHRKPSQMAAEFRRRMTVASLRKPEVKPKPRRIGKNAAAQNDY